MSKRKSVDDYEYLKKKFKKYERRLQRLCPHSQGSASPIAHTSHDEAEHTGIDPEDWLQDSPEVNNRPEVWTVVPDDIPDPVISVDHVVSLDPIVTTDPVASADPAILQDKPSTSREAFDENIDADLDQDTMVLLGDDPSTTVKYGPDLHKELTKRFQHITTEGLDKDCRKALLAKYLIPSNCRYIAAPTLNAELKAAIPKTAAKRDKSIVVKQEQMETAISCLGQVITSQLITKNNDLLPKLMDVARIMCDIQHYDSVTRRNFILSSLKRDMKDALSCTKIDEFLFGESLSETIKTAKAVTKSGIELKPDSVTKNVPKRPNSSTMPQRHLNRKAPAPARRPPGPPPRSRGPAPPRLPPPPPLANSSMRLPPRHQPQRRY